MIINLNERDKNILILKQKVQDYLGWVNNREVDFDYADFQLERAKLTLDKIALELMRLRDEQSEQE